MNPDHYEFTLAINLTPEEQDLSVLFSGEGDRFPDIPLDRPYMIST